MDDEEWQLLLNDCQLATPTFSDERLMQVFEEEVELRGHSLDAAEWLAFMVPTHPWALWT